MWWYTGESLGYTRYVLCRTILCRMVDFVGKLGHHSLRGTLLTQEGKTIDKKASWIMVGVYEQGFIQGGGGGKTWNIPPPKFHLVLTLFGIITTKYVSFTT